MDCLRNFTLRVSQSRTFNVPAVNIKSWGIPNTNSFVINSPTTTTLLNLNSSRTLEIYKVKIVGTAVSTLGINGGILEDYGFEIGIGGLLPTISGSFFVNDYTASLLPSTYRLTKYIPEITFEQPITGCQAVSLLRFFGQGRDLENLNIFQCDIDISVMFYYKFDGE